MNFTVENIDVFGFNKIVNFVKFNTALYTHTQTHTHTRRCSDISFISIQKIFMLGICLNIPKTAYVENRQFSEKNTYCNKNQFLIFMKKTVFLILSIFFIGNIFGQGIATTNNGLRVNLYSDFTWNLRTLEPFPCEDYLEYSKN